MYICLLFQRYGICARRDCAGRIDLAVCRSLRVVCVTDTLLLRFYFVLCPHLFMDVWPRGGGAKQACMQGTCPVLLGHVVLCVLYVLMSVLCFRTVARVYFHKYTHAHVDAYTH